MRRLFRRAISISCAVILLLPQPVQASRFADVRDDDWFASYVETLAAKTIISTNNKFFPNRTITRAELAKMAVNAASSLNLTPPSNTNTQVFCDVPLNYWAIDYINTLQRKGIVGTPSNCPQGRNFLPNNPITRAEALKVIFKVFNLTPSGQSSFADVAPTAWYSSYINTATTMQIVNGYQDGTFGPNGFLTRAEMSKIMTITMSKIAEPNGPTPTSNPTPTNSPSPTATPSSPTGSQQIVITAAQGEGALRDAINNAEPGDEIALAAGNYRLSRQLWIEKNGTAAQPIIIRSKDGPLAAKISGSPEEGINIGDGASYIIIDGLEIFGMGDNVIHIQNAHHITIQNNKVRDAGRDGDVIKVNQSEHISVINNELARSGNRPSCPDGNCWQELIDFVDVNDSLIKNNTMSDFGNLAGYVKGGSTNVVIENNTITGQRAGAIDPAWGIGGWTDSDLIQGQYEANNITFTNNTISNSSYGALGIYDASRVTISNNQFTSNRGSLIEFRSGNGPAAKSDTVAITNNAFNNNQTTDTSVCHLLGHGLTGLSISGNTGNNTAILSATSCN
ncbi:S-layer homology domain-containing protein [Candidatus Gracilibacteria bacterium]|nr:S-layer homology domain-containing protein [Candidatus Gracilibacteria bacterium]